MIHVTVGAVLAVMLAVGPAVGAPAPQQEDGTVRIFVFPRTQPELEKSEKKRLEKEAKSARKRAEKARKDVNKALEARYGKKEGEWPEEAIEEASAARRAEMMALVAHHEVQSKQKEMTDSANDLISALEDQMEDAPHLALADSREQADLLVEVLTRRKKASFPSAAQIIYVRVTPVGWEDPAQTLAESPFGQTTKHMAYLGQIMGFQHLKGKVWALHDYTDEEPYWILEAYQQGSAWRGPAYTLAQVLDIVCAALVQPEITEDGSSL